MNEEKSASQELRDSIDELVGSFGAIPTSWDAVIFGDGSGSRWGYPGGAGAILVDRDSGLTKTFGIALSDATVNICELIPYIFSLLWYSHKRGKDLQKQRMAAGHPFILNIHIFTDCEIIANQGNKQMARETNMPLWWAIDAFERAGFNLIFHWIPRDTYRLNQACDRISKSMRLLITDQLEIFDSAESNTDDENKDDVS